MLLGWQRSIARNVSRATVTVSLLGENSSSRSLAGNAMLAGVPLMQRLRNRETWDEARNGPKCP
jgi:hypothetical protein